MKTFLTVAMLKQPMSVVSTVHLLLGLQKITCQTLEKEKNGLDKQLK